jgi:MOSC domain-containing protein YiiM
MNAPAMKLLSINVALPKEITHRGRRVRTSIFKEPVQGRRAVGLTNLEGDRQADLRVHGGRDKALYVYDRGNALHWEEQLGRAMPPGEFGENLTVEGMPETEVQIGDRFRIGSAIVEVSEPRSPCFKLGLKMGDPTFLKPFLESGRTGFYLRVIEPGEIASGDAIARIARDPDGITVLEATRLLYSPIPDARTAGRALRIASLSDRLRRAFSERIAARA